MPDYLDLELHSPWLNASGTLGFAPTAEDWTPAELQGGFVTNPISANPRTPAENRAALSYPGGALLHSGHPNPGLRAVLRKYGERWARSSLPIWAHLLADGPDDIHRMVLALEEVEGVTAVKIGVPPGAEKNLALAMLDAAVGELPVIAGLPLEAAGVEWLRELPGLGVRGLCLSAPRGAMAPRRATFSPTASSRPLQGRLVGAGLAPLALAALQALLPLQIPLIAGCGVSSLESGRDFLAAGASAVQLDTLLWQ